MVRTDAGPVLGDAPGTLGPAQPRRSELGAIAAELGLDATSLDECLTAPASASSIDADEQEGARLGVSSTPTFFMGQRGENGAVSLVWRLRGAAPYSVFEQALRRELGT
jgi:predicted DsbA family dithiol-disulfide isomerase